MASNANINPVHSSYLGFVQFFPMLVGSAAFAILQRLSPYQNAGTISMAVNLAVIMLSALILILAPAWQHLLGRTDMELSRFIGPLGVCIYCLFFLAGILTFITQASSMIHTADIVVGSILFSLVLGAFIGYSAYYIYDKYARKGVANTNNGP